MSSEVLSSDYEECKITGQKQRQSLLHQTNCHQGRISPLACQKVPEFSKLRLSRAKNVKMTERDLKKLWPENEWNKRHLQIIFFGREHCPARGHNLDNCLICNWAASKKRITQEAKK